MDNHLDGEGDYTPSSNQTGSEAPVNQARLRDYKIFTIGLNIEPGSNAEDNLVDIASATGGQYSSPAAENLDSIFGSILQTVIRETNTAPENIDIVEVTEEYIENESNFSIEPTSINQTGGGMTEIIWQNISRHAGNNDGKLTANETVVITFSAGSSQVGNALPVNSQDASFVSYFDVVRGSEQRARLPQAYINAK